MNAKFEKSPSSSTGGCTRPVLVVVEDVNDIQFLRSISAMLHDHDCDLPDLASMERAGRLAFVPFLIIDRKMEVMEALSKSWEMTKGYGWHIFFMGFLAFWIVILGLLALIFGVIIPGYGFPLPLQSCTRQS